MRKSYQFNIKENIRKTKIRKGTEEFLPSISIDVKKMVSIPGTKNGRIPILGTSREVLARNNGIFFSVTMLVMPNRKLC